MPVIEVTGLRRSYRSRAGVLLIFCGTNVALTAVAGLVGTEAAVGLLYVVIGMALLRFFEAESRRRATLHTA